MACNSVSLLQHNTSANGDGPAHRQSHLGSCFGYAVGDEGYRNCYCDLDAGVGVEGGILTAGNTKVTRYVVGAVEGGRVTV